jgi:hypothetical protein
MNKLSTKHLLEAYIHAIEINLSKEFIDLLDSELQKRYNEKSLLSMKNRKM